MAETMVRENKSIQQAAWEHNVEATTEELKAVEKGKGFQKILWTERHKYYQALASDPNRSKASLLGQMIFAVQKLLEEGSWDKALEGALKVAKVEGFVGSDNQVTIFGGLTPADLEEAKAKIAERLQPSGTVTQRPGNA